MKKRILLPTAVIILFTMLLAGCGGMQTNTPQEPTFDEKALRTEIVQTVQAVYTIDAALTLAAAPSATPIVFTPTEIATETLQASNTPEPEEIIPTATTKWVVYPSYTPTYYSDSAELLSMTPALGKSFKPGADFDLTLILKNTGVLQWTTSYRLEYISGVEATNQNGKEYTIVYLTKNVNTGKQIEMHIDMVAPSQPGYYTSTWGLVNTDSTTFYTISYGFYVAK